MNKENYWEKLTQFAKATGFFREGSPMLKAEISSGNFVKISGKQAVFCEERPDGQAKIIIKEAGGPAFDFVDMEDLEPVPGSVDSDIERYADFWDVIKNMTADKLLKAGNLLESFNLFKAGPPRPGMVMKKIRVIRDGKIVNMTTYVNPDKDKKKPGSTNKNEDGDTAVTVGKRSETYKALIPTKEEFKSMQDGDMDALANYLQDRFWTAPLRENKKVQTLHGKEEKSVKKEGSVTIINKLANAFRKSKIEGYEIEDVVQETALNLLENQAKGKLKEVEFDKFPAYVATVMANLNRNLRRKSRVDKNVGTAIDEMADYITDGSTVEKDYEAAESAAYVKQTVNQIKSKLNDWMETTGVRKKQELPKVKSVVSQYFRGRSMQEISDNTGVSNDKVRNWISRYVVNNNNLDKFVREAGYSGASAVKDFIKDWRRANDFHKARIISRKGNLVFFKADHDEHEIYDTIELFGLGIAIENPVGSVRAGIDADGNEWQSQMSFAYGYIMNTEGGDGEEIDVFIGPYLNSEKVYVVSINEQGEGQEDKVFLGFQDGVQAVNAFEEHYSNPFSLIDKVSEYGLKEFLNALTEGRKSLKKAKVEVGHVTTRKDGSKWKKTAPGKWVKQSEGKKSKDSGEQESGKGEKSLPGKSESGGDGNDGPKEKFKHRMASAIKEMVKNISDAMVDAFAGKSDSGISGGVAGTTREAGAAAKKETAIRDAENAKNKKEVKQAENNAGDKLK